MSIESRGEYIASCSSSKVIIFGLYSNDCNNVFDFDRSVHCVAIDPLFCKPGGGRRLVTGDERVVLHEKTFLARYKSTLLHEGYGQIRAIKWRGNLIAFSSDTGIRIFDMDERNVICFMARDSGPSADVYKSCLCWKSDTEFIIGCGRSIKIGQVTKRNLRAVDSDKLPSKQVIIPSMCTIDPLICGVAPLENNTVILGLYEKQSDSNPSEKSLIPHMLIIESMQEDFEEISNDLLSLRTSKDQKNENFTLEYLASDGIYFIVCPKDLIMATPKEDDERISWLIDRKYFDEALDLVKRTRSCRNHTTLSVGKAFLNYLFEQNDIECFERAGKLCETILGNDKIAWKEQVKEFQMRGQLKYLAPFIPTGSPVSLDKETYESILIHFLDTDVDVYLDLIKTWPSSLYNVPDMTNALLQAYGKDPANKKLSEALALLYIHEGEPEKAVVILLDIRAGEKVFELIRNCKLNRFLLEKLETLMSINPFETSKLLLEQRDTIPIDFVVDKLRDRHDLLWAYLDKVVEQDGDRCAIHHDLLVSLYAQFTPERLLKFLQTSNHYSLEKALKICEKFHLIPETVYLLARMGNSKEALKCIIDRMSNINYAIDFCKEHSDAELWEDLINYSLRKPQFISALLLNVGTNIPDPISFVRRIPEGLEIDGLKGALLKILRDYRLMSSAKKERRDALVNNCFKLLEKLNKDQKRGALINETTVCDECSKRIFARGLQQTPEIAIFNCKHIFHKECLAGLESELCCSVCPPGPKILNKS
ncbi:vacuolar protein sorting-associated protein 41 homolog isoform X4 [Brevipalpus obovatus]